MATGNDNKNTVIELNSSTKQKSKMPSSSTWAANILKRDHIPSDVTTKKQKVYNFLERPEGFQCLLYHFLVFIVVLVCLSLSVLSTTEDYASSVANGILYWLEISLVAFFTLEYFLRVWASGSRGKYIGFWGRLRFIRKPICIIDLVVICASGFVLLVGSKEQFFPASAIRGIRFLQILRMLRVDRQGGTWKLLGSVIYDHRQELITSLYIGFLGLMFSSYFVFLAEKDTLGDEEETQFESYGDAVWWGVVTFTTIGYGDKVPRTLAGRAITCFFSLVIISFITLPSGILGSGFALKVQQEQRKKHFSRQIPTAAILIQAAWRCHASEKGHPSVATWKIHVTEVKPEPVVPGKRRFTSYWRIKQRSKSESSSPEMKRKNEKRYGGGYDNYALQDSSYSGMRGEPDSPVTLRNAKFNGSSDVFYGADAASGDELDYDVESQRVTVLTETHKNAIRAIRKMKYCVARRNFGQAKRPYDVQDVIEQYSQGHLNMMFRIKELQRRLERTVGKPHVIKATDTGETKNMTIGARLLKMEQKITTIERKLDQILAILDD